MDVIPSDFVINGIISAAWKTGIGAKCLENDLILLSQFSHQGT